MVLYPPLNCAGCDGTLKNPIYPLQTKGMRKSSTEKPLAHSTGGEGSTGLAFICDRRVYMIESGLNVLSLNVLILVFEPRPAGGKFLSAGNHVIFPSVVKVNHQG